MNKIRMRTTDAVIFVQKMKITDLNFIRFLVCVYTLFIPSNNAPFKREIKRFIYTQSFGNLLLI